MVSKAPATARGDNSSEDNNEKMDSYLNPANIAATIRNLIPFGGQLIKSFIDKANMQTDGGQILQAAIQFGQPDITKMLIERGVDVQTPPNQVSPIGNDPQAHLQYRKSPFIIQAACAGSLENFKLLLQAGCQITDVGHIGFSKRYRNQVISNVIGAAAFHGREEIIKYCVQHVDASFVDALAKETSDKNSKSDKIKTEYAGFTPLQLAVVGSKPNVNIVRILLEKDANSKIKTGAASDNILHLCAKKCDSFEVLDFLVKNADIDIFARNNEGDSPLTICQQRNFKEAIELFEKYQELLDQSSSKAQALLDELEGDQAKNEKARQKKKEKKQRSKLQKLADKNGCTIEELEGVFRKQEEDRKREEKEREMEVLRREQEEEQRAREEREERLRAIQRQQEEELRQIEEERAAERRRELAERAAKNAARAELQKKRQEAERIAEEKRMAESKGMNRKERKALENAERKAEKARNEVDKEPQENQADEPSSTDQTESGAVAAAVEEPSKATGKPMLAGLTGELALQKMGKHARKKLLQEQRLKEEQDRELKERILKAKEMAQLEKKRKEKEDRQRAIEAKKAERENAKLREQQAKEKAEAERAAQKETEIKAKEEQKRAKQAEKRKENRLKKQAERAAAQQQNPTETEAAQTTTPQEESQEKAENPVPVEVQETPANDSSAPKNESKKKRQAKKEKKEDAVSEEKKVEEQPKTDKEDAQKQEEESRQAAAARTELQNQLDAALEMKAYLTNELEQMHRQRDEQQQKLIYQAELMQELTEHNSSLEEKIAEFENDESTKVTAGERELQKQLKKVTEKHTMQLNVNKTLTSKLLIIEKALIDEKRARMEAERKLMASNPPMGPEQDFQQENNGAGYILNGSASNSNDLAWVQSQLASVQKRVQHSLNQRR